MAGSRSTSPAPRARSSPRTTGHDPRAGFFADRDADGARHHGRARRDRGPQLLVPVAHDADPGGIVPTFSIEQPASDSKIFAARCISVSPNGAPYVKNAAC